MAVLAFVIGLHAFISDQHGRTAEIIAGSPSLTTRQFMAEQAIELIVEKPGVSDTEALNIGACRTTPKNSTTVNYRVRFPIT